MDEQEFQRRKKGSLNPCGEREEKMNVGSELAQKRRTRRKYTYGAQYFFFSVWLYVGAKHANGSNLKP